MNRRTDQAVMLTRLQNRILARKGLVACGPEFTVALHSRGKVVYAGSDRWGQGDCTRWEGVSALACTGDRVVALMRDGTLQVAGKEPMDAALGGLSHIRAVACCGDLTAALLGNGRVLVSGTSRRAFAPDTSEWPAVTDVVCGADFAVGLTPTGRVVVAGGSHRLRHILGMWDGIAGLFTDHEGETVYGITVEGRLLSTRPLPHAARSWKNLIFMAAAGGHIRGITATGLLCTTAPVRTLGDLGRSEHYVACAAAPDHTAAVTRDGLVLSSGDNAFGQCRTLRFGTLFTGFEEFSSDRREGNLRTATAAKTYQMRLTEAYRYQSRLVCGERLTACLTADGRVLTSVGFGEAKQWTRVRALACGNAHLVALREGGDVLADGNDTEGCTAVSEWHGIKSVAAGKYHTLGVTEDGRVLFCGRNDKGQGDVTEWSGIRRVYAAADYTVGLGYDGTLRIAGQPPFKPEMLNANWNHPVDVAVTATHMAALYENGTVLSTRAVPASDRPGDGETRDTCRWRGVRAIAAGDGFTVGLCYGGRVVAVGANDRGQCNVSTWKDVVAVDCGRSYTVGLTSDGRVLSAGCVRKETLLIDPLSASEQTLRIAYVPPETEEWREVVALTAGPEHAVAMNREGQILATGLDSDGQCTATAHFSLFRDVRQLYGYGKYRKLAEEDALLPQETEPRGTSQGDIHALLPMAQFSAHLRADTEALVSRLAGSDDHLTVLCEDGIPVTYRYETATAFAESPASSIARMVAVGDGTLYLYSDGTARERTGCTPDAPMTTLPGKLGDSPFYRVSDVAMGTSHRTVLLRDGTVRSFGENDRGQCDTGDWKQIKAVAAGDHHTVGLRADGTVTATGARHREVGNRTRGVAHLPRANPCAVEEWRGVQRVVCARNVTLGICSDGTVKAAGSNQYGQCNTDSWRGTVSVVTSGYHTVALFADGRVEAVGLNENGECRTESWTRIIQIAVMPELTLGLRADGKVLAAGRHHSVLNTLDTVRAIACFGNRRQVFVMADGTLRIHMRGSEFLPEPLGSVRMFTPSVEHSVLDRHTFRGCRASTALAVLNSFGVGMAHTVTLGKGGMIAAEGNNDSGQCDVRACGTAVQVSAGPYHTAAILANGTVALSGRNTHGRSDATALNRELAAVGILAEESRNSSMPTVSAADPASLPYAWKQVACGHSHTAALRSDGRVYAVGESSDGRCDTRQWRNVTHLSCGVRHTVACTEEGACVATGDNRYGQCDVSLWKQITMTAAGEFHTVGLRADGRVEATGDNRHGQCRVEDLRDIISVACLPEATLCVRADGRVILRGGSGELDRAVDALREVVAIHTCEHRIAALTVDRRVILIP